MTDRSELAAFLRDRRGRITPSDVGLPETGRRRTPGLRRQEVAQLAGMSVEYYVRLEQARGPNPSGQVLSALARALVLSVDERTYLFRMAGAEPPPVRSPAREVSLAIRHLLDSLTATPAYVLDAKYDVLAWNTLATHFIGDMAEVDESERNIVTWMFCRPDDPRAAERPEATCMERQSVADLRAAYARYPGDPGINRVGSGYGGGSDGPVHGGPDRRRQRRQALLPGQHRDRPLDGVHRGQRRRRQPALITEPHRLSHQHRQAPGSRAQPEPRHRQVRDGRRHRRRTRPLAKERHPVPRADREEQLGEGREQRDHAPRRCRERDNAAGGVGDHDRARFGNAIRRAPTRIPRAARNCSGPCLRPARERR